MTLNPTGKIECSLISSNSFFSIAEDVESVTLVAFSVRLNLDQIASTMSCALLSGARDNGARHHNRHPTSNIFLPSTDICLVIY
jgi:hypothetical protein